MYKTGLPLLAMIIVLTSCTQKTPPSTGRPVAEEDFEYVIDRFADIEIMRYTVDDWDDLSLSQKTLIYYLSEAALCGRDILFDQNCKYNLDIKNVLNIIIHTYHGNKGEDWDRFMTYAKRFWFSNGIHHHYSSEKFSPEVSRDYFRSLMDQSRTEEFPLQENEDYNRFRDRIIDIIYNPAIAPVRTSHQAGKDLISNSAVNFYEGVNQAEVEDFYEALKKNDKTADTARPLSYGLNSKLVKDEKGKIVEFPYKVGGLYSPAIERIIYWLEKASEVAENPIQKEHIDKLIDYYRTGDLKTWDEYNIIWVKDVDSHVDYVNGFIEVYNDPLGRKATWEALVNFKDEKNSERTEIIARNAQWFEDHSPVAPQFKKKEVKGVVAKVINAVQLGGDCYPATAIGINLPNANWIRKEYGSKSVTIHNIMYAYAQARLQSGYTHEFYASDYEINLQDKYGFITENLQVDLHECLGHGSGQMLPGVDDGSLKNYHSTIEETRADLFSLYFIADPKMVELGLLPNEEAYYACYYKYIMNGLMLQLNRIELGNTITQSHMRNRAIIANWCYQAGLENNVIEKVKRDEKTYFVIHDYEKLRELIGRLLTEVQRIKSTGDYAAARKLVETYGIRIDRELHKEVLDRYALLDMAPYGGFVNPVLTPVLKDDKIVDVKIEYVTDYTQQMLSYDQTYHYLR